jgi:ferric-dicitrate binding protein FerR (iron transport regulator)
MERKTDIWYSISSVLEGDYTAEEKRSVDNWLLEDEKNQTFFNKLKETPFSEDIEQSAGMAQERVYLQTQEKISKVLLRRKLRFWQYVAAASIILLFVISGLSVWKTESLTLLSLESRSPAGSTTRLILSDGTSVELNAGSSLAYPSSFQGGNRTVSLTGEAYFEVAKDAKRPFIVETDGMKVEVLGTHFNVKSYADDDKLIATLMEGSIRVEPYFPDHSSGKPIILKPNEQMVFDKITKEIKVSGVNADLYASWKNGECFFENEKFIDIAKNLGRQYGVRVSVVSPNLENQLYSGFFSKQEGLFHILNSFRRNRNFEYRQTDTGIEIYERTNLRIVEP